MGKATATAINVCASGRQSMMTDYTGHMLYITNAFLHSMTLKSQGFYIFQNALQD